MTNPSAALIIIGDEILSGRTLDQNTQYIAKTLGTIGVDLVEVRVISDKEQKIIDAVNELRACNTYVFTTGGIGPTHDDITAESIAKAFGQKLIRHKKAYSLLVDYYGEDNMNEGRAKMAYVPENAELVDNEVTIAPGFKVGNVFVMAGVPRIMQAMLEAIIPQLEKGVEVVSKTVKVMCAESIVAKFLGDLQNKYKKSSIGSYPFMKTHEFDMAGTNVVIRSRDEENLNCAITELEDWLKQEAINFERLED